MWWSWSPEEESSEEEEGDVAGKKKIKTDDGVKPARE